MTEPQRELVVGFSVVDYKIRPFYSACRPFLLYPESVDVPGFVDFGIGDYQQIVMQMKVAHINCLPIKWLVLESTMENRCFTIEDNRNNNKNKQSTSGLSEADSSDTSTEYVQVWTAEIPKFQQLQPIECGQLISYADVDNFGYVILFCEIGRQISIKTLSRRYRRVAIEFFGTLQLCACVFETTSFYVHYGLLGFYIGLTCVIFVNILTVREASTNSAQIVEDRFVKRTLNDRNFLLLFLAQMVAGFLAFRLGKTFWRFELNEFHRERYMDFICSSDCSVSRFEGMFYEFLATLITRFLVMKIADSYSLWPALTIISIVCSTVTVIGLTLTGMYLNPVLASSLTFGCEGLSSLDHMIVYWIGPVCGWIAGTKLYENIKL